MVNICPQSSPDPCDRFLACALALLAAVVLALLLTACSPRVIETIQVQHDTTYVERVRVDSVWRRDSIYIKDKGDTVWIYKEMWRDRYKLLRDTVRVVRVDSVAVEREVIVEVEKPLSWWQTLKLRSFWPFCGALFALLAWTFRKPLWKLIKR